MTELPLILNHASGKLFQEAHYKCLIDPQLVLEGFLPPEAMLLKEKSAQAVGVYYTPAVLARTLVEARAIPPEYPEDALHIAVAAMNGCDFVLTWNFTHLNNVLTRADIRHVIEEQGFESPEICSPEEMFGESP